MRITVNSHGVGIIGNISASILYNAIFFSSLWNFAFDSNVMHILHSRLHSSHKRCPHFVSKAHEHTEVACCDADKMWFPLQHWVILPVESIAHLNGDQHRQGHGHGRSGLKDLAVKASEVLILIAALHEVGLHRGEVRSISFCVWAFVWVKK